MSRRLLVLPILLGIAMLPGCESSSGPAFSGGHPQVVASPDKVSAMLVDSADRASTALETLAAVERARTPSANTAPLDNVPAELRRAISVNWVGPIEPIAKTLADRASYGFLVIGTTPSTPAVVSLDVENGKIIDGLRDLGLQLGMRGDLKVDARRKMVEIHYAPVEGISE
jgi:defect-in-organelle-trafficking protein DotD